MVAQFLPSELCLKLKQVFGKYMCVLSEPLTDPLPYRGLSWFEVLIPDTEALDVIQARIADSQYPVTETEDGIAVTGPDETEVQFRIGT